MIYALQKIGILLICTIWTTESYWNCEIRFSSCVITQWIIAALEPQDESAYCQRVHDAFTYDEDIDEDY